MAQETQTGALYRSRTVGWGRRWFKQEGVYEEMGSIKDRNGMDPTEEEDIKKRWH